MIPELRVLDHGRGRRRAQVCGRGDLGDGCRGPFEAGSLCDILLGLLGLSLGLPLGPLAVLFGLAELLPLGVEPCGGLFGQANDDGFDPLRDFAFPLA